MIPVKRITFLSSVRFRGSEHTFLDVTHPMSGKQLAISWEPRHAMFCVRDTETKQCVYVLYANVRYFETDETNIVVESTPNDRTRIYAIPESVAPPPANLIIQADGIVPVPRRRGRPFKVKPETNS